MNNMIRGQWCRRRRVIALHDDPGTSYYGLHDYRHVNIAPMKRANIRPVPQLFRKRGYFLYLPTSRFLFHKTI